MPDPPPGPDTLNSNLSALERAQQLVDIASDDGDVILILEFARLRVCSPILCSASAVFKAMLGPHFSEGQATRSPQNPKEISLPEDDTFAMKRLCRLIHHQSDPLESALEEAPAAEVADWLYNLIAVADKYCCLEAIEGVVKYELSCFATPSVSMALAECDLIKLIATAFIFDSNRYFAYFTRCLALDGIMLYSNLANDPPLQRLPASLLRKFRPQRSQRYQDLTATTVLADEQRSQAWRVINLELPALSAHQCPTPGCEIFASDLKFPTTLLRKP